jgi:alpha-glucosidase
MMTRALVITGIWMVAQVALGADNVVVKSPDGRLSLQVGVDQTGQLTYQLSRGKVVIMEPAPLGLTIDGTPWGRGVTLGRPERWGVDETYAWRGVHSRARNRPNVIRIPVTHTAGGGKYTLEARVFDDGAGFRYVLADSAKHRVGGEDTAFQLPKSCAIWGQTNTKNYEGFYERVAIEQAKQDTYYGPPVVAELPGGSGYVALTEAALFNYSGMTLRAVGGDSRRLAAAFEDDKEWEPAGRVTSPWRVIIVAADLNGLVNSDIIPNLNEPPSSDLAHADWIRPGRGFWHWWSGTIGNWDSVAFDRQNAWVDQAANFGFEYYLVDAGWEHTWHKPGQDKWALLAELTKYAAGKKVGIFVWKRWNTGQTEGIEMEGLDDPASRREFFRRCKEAGAVGIKIDYMDSESKQVIDFYTDVLKDAAAAKLMVDFHGANKPTGESRTYPHEMTREGVRGLEYNKWSTLPPAHYAALPFTRFLAGPGDFTPCTFNPQMLKGTTFALQLATAVCFTSPVMFYADKPELYLKTPAVDVIKAIPSVWDETLVLPGSKIGDLAVMARRQGTTWFIGVINGGSKRTQNLDLSFLGKGQYSCVQLADNPARPDDLVRTETNVSRSTSLDVALNAGGGFVAMLKPAGR